MGRTSDARERLIAGAGELIQERGYHAVGVSEICARAGVNKGSFYHFFPSKQELTLEVIRRFWSDYQSRLEDALINERPPLERLALYLRGTYQNHVVDCSDRGRQTGCPLANLALEMSTSDAVMRARLLQAFEGQLSYFEGLLREAQKLGELPEDLNLRSAAEMILSLIEGKIMLSKLRDDPQTLCDLEDVVFRALGLPPFQSS